MALLNVNPTRMELLRLKEKIKQSQRGHKLLKDMQDGLISKFMEIVDKIKKLRIDVEGKLLGVYKNYKIANASVDERITENILSSPSVKVNLKVDEKNVMSVRIPYFSITKEGDAINYGFYNTSGDLDLAFQNMNLLIEDLVKLSQVEKQAERLAIEIEKTRRRVNALEHKIIPDQLETKKFITLKLSEAERSSLITTMKVKSMIEASEK